MLCVETCISLSHQYNTCHQKYRKFNFDFLLAVDWKILYVKVKFQVTCFMLQFTCLFVCLIFPNYFKSIL